MGTALFWPEVTGLAGVHARWQVPLLLLAAGFAAGHLAAIRFEVSGEMQAVTLSEVPLLIGLVYAGPNRLLLATAIGTVAAIAWRRQQPVKAAFALSVRLLETMVAVECFHAILGSVTPISPRGALAALMAVVAANLVSTLCVQVVIALSVGRFERSGLKTMMAVLGGVAVLNVAVGMVTVDLLWGNRLAVIPFLGIAASIGFGYRYHSELRRRHRDLEEMYRFSRALAGLNEAEEVVSAVLTEAKTRLRAACAELALDGADGTVRYRLRDDGPLTRIIDDAEHPLSAAVARGEGRLLAQKSTGNAGVSGALTASCFGDAVAVSLPSVNGIAGTLIVADRLGDAVTFNDADLDLLGVLANQTETALHSAQLLDWLRQEVAEKNHLALHDSLTKLPNRALFNERVESALGQRQDPGLVALMLLDLNRFKEVNDTLGHESGDLVLQQVAQQVTHAVAGTGSVARLGGDEFGVVVCVRDHAQLARVVEAVVDAGQAAVSSNGVRLEVSASLGVAVAPDHGSDRSSLLRAADIGMYHAKANGGSFAYYEPVRDALKAGPSARSGAQPSSENFAL